MKKSCVSILGSFVVLVIFSSIMHSVPAGSSQTGQKCQGALIVAVTRLGLLFAPGGIGRGDTLDS